MITRFLWQGMDRNLRHPLEAGHRLTEIFGPLVRND